MISKRTKRGIKLITAVAICVFTLLATLTSSLAWFSFNKKSEINGMSIRVAMNMTDVNGVTVHRCKLSESTSTLLKIESEPSVRLSGSGSVQEISGIEMDNYSILNQSQPVLLLFTFKDGIEAGSINITATSDNNAFVSAATITRTNSTAARFSTTYNVAGCSANLVDATVELNGTTIAVTVETGYQAKINGQTYNPA